MAGRRGREQMMTTPRTKLTEPLGTVTALFGGFMLFTTSDHGALLRIIEKDGA